MNQRKIIIIIRHKSKCDSLIYQKTILFDNIIKPTNTIPTRILKNGK